MAPSSSRQVISGWKAIATYTGKAIRTVQDWEKDSGLPIYREPGGVWAYADDLDRFLQGRIVAPAIADGETANGSGNHANGEPSTPPDNSLETDPTKSTEQPGVIGNDVH